jgi:hypothetical protein
VLGGSFMVGAKKRGSVSRNVSGAFGKAIANTHLPGNSNFGLHLCQRQPYSGEW